MEILKNEKMLGILQGSCGDKNFGFCWKEEAKSADKSFIYGKFQIIVNGQALLKENRVYDINVIVSYFKDDLMFLKKSELYYSDKSKDELFITACRHRLAWTFEEFEAYEKGVKTEEEIWKELENDDGEEFVGGYEFFLYPDISDQGWQFFLFRNEERERLLCSNNHGKTVLEAQLPLGTVEKVLSELPNC